VSSGAQGSVLDLLSLSSWSGLGSEGKAVSSGGEERVLELLSLSLCLMEWALL
jgi:hypothetical protein